MENQFVAQNSEDWEIEGALQQEKAFLQISSRASSVRNWFDMGLLLMCAAIILGGWQVWDYVQTQSRALGATRLKENVSLAQQDFSDGEQFSRLYKMSGNQDFAERYNLAMRRLEQHMHQLDKQLQKDSSGFGFKPLQPKFEDLKIQIQSFASITVKGSGGRQVSNVSADAPDFTGFVHQLDDMLQDQQRELESLTKIILGLVFCSFAVAVVLILFWRNWLSVEKKKVDSFNHILESKHRDLMIAQKQARVADEIKTQFLNNMSHEIRTPLNAVIGLGQLLGDTELTSQQDDFLRGVQGASKSLLALINDVLDFGKIQKQGLELVPEDFFLQDMTAELGAILRGHAKTKVLALDIQCAKDLPQIHADPLRLRQVLFNLCSNALKFTEQGSVTLRIQKQNEILRIEVQDTGIGIPKESQGRIFQAFYQTDASLERHYEGTGLGLSICKSIIEKMHGQIGFSSTYGVGTTFYAEVPAVWVEGTSWVKLAKQSATQKVLAWQGRMPAKTLIVEDNELNQKVLQGYLKRMGLPAAEICEDGVQALQTLKHNTYDLVFLDCQLPGISGFSVIRELRKRGVTSYVVATTAHASENYRQECIDAGMSDYLSKPLEQEKLFGILRRFESSETQVDVIAEIPVMTAAAATVQLVSASAVGNLDRSRWKKMQQLSSDGGPSFLQEMIQIFLQIYPEKYVRLLQACKDQDREQVHSLAHYLKSSCSDLGATQMVQICQQLEEDESLSATAQQELIVALGQEFSAIEPALRAELPAAA